MAVATLVGPVASLAACVSVAVPAAVPFARGLYIISITANEFAMRSWQADARRAAPPRQLPRQPRRQDRSFAMLDAGIFFERVAQVCAVTSYVTPHATTPMIAAGVVSTVFNVWYNAQMAAQ